MIHGRARWVEKEAPFSCDKVREWHGHIDTTKRKIDS